MNPPFNPGREGFDERRAEHAVFGAEGAPQAVGHAADPPVCGEELIAASVYLAGSAPPGGLPPGLRERLVADVYASDSVSAPAGAGMAAPADVNQRWLGGVLALAASIALVAGILWPKSTATPTPLEARQSFLKSYPTLTPIAWTATDDPAAQGAEGDVVWSDAQQQGYMTFAGLPANDPSKTQYQLWVFDAQRDERYPVDGGVFDIPQGEESVVVPIAVKLPVNRATMFAVTIEPAGGVVVSDRSRLPLLAKTAADG
ncbi:Anti-sigma-K factor rskA [Pirellulimonas nuda]|uniref:Anti-sigma-K factor rskA n=1 Tax=Pirellulimonas nuda TaxID=2528009 RepID=A0A518DH33_9BACT|nr:anti-sigma factor [Pirellulimonas nuda]QDU90783.1 Anti-sigma-K factor rskA [Pirellulimonas nuda]